jgi:hypothetical protein
MPGQLHSVSVAMAEGRHPVPSRTRKLSPLAPMVLPGRPGGRVGRRRDSYEAPPDPGRRFRVRAPSFLVTNPDGKFLVEQQADYETNDGVIPWMRVLCSGYQPVPPADGGAA